jgi:uncharacterized protein YyaL (SSP411 family)
MNKLINEVSTYLLQHKDNPVHWEAWNDESLERSIIEDKPIIISIGYAACHWCHVMEHESFEDPEVADLMNEHFINIKIDREERPDLDMIYMEAVQKMGIRGGWPLNVFLLPNKKPFYGGTYFPKKNWISILKSVDEAFKFNRTELNNSADGFSESLNDNNLSFNPINIDVQSTQLEKAYQKVKGSLDPVFGGIKQAPKFPLPCLLDFLINLPNSEYLKLGVNELYNVQLQKMAQGGIYDQIEGGFSRYSVDSEWFCPHFEKMLYDNVQLIKTYSLAFSKTNNDLYKEVVADTIHFLNEQLMGDNGLYFSSIDADSEGEEGKYYTWEFEELNSIIPYKNNQDFYNHFSITSNGNWENNNNILFKNSPISNQQFSTQLEILKNAKLTRIKPNTDTKQILSWNSILVSSLIHAYSTFNNHAYLESAKTIIKQIENHFMFNEIYLHQVKYSSKPIIAFLDDMAFLTKAYIDLYEVSGDTTYINKANNCLINVLENFKTNKSQTVFYNYYSNKSEKLIADKYEINDSVMPSSNSILCECLYKMGFINQVPEYTLKAKEMLENIMESAFSNPLYFSNWLKIYGDYMVYPKALIKYNANFIHIDQLKGTDFPIDKTMINFTPILHQDKYNFYLCIGDTCYSPTNSIKELQIQMKSVI